MNTISKNSTIRLLTLFCGLLAVLVIQIESAAAQVKGTGFREQIALPPDANQVSLALTRAHGNDIQIMLHRVAASTSASKSTQTGALATLPASFIGELPCADCPGIRYHINLFPDRVFFLQTTHIGRSDDAVYDDIGTWVVSSDRTMLVFKGGREASAMFRIRDENTLRMLNVEGRDIESPLNYDLQRTKNFEPLEPRLAMRGMYRYFADAGLFTECLTRRRWPVAQEKECRPGISLHQGPAHCGRGAFG
jgi:uncharacterized lipoprotein NlpE involved in copper resistance